MISTLLTAYYKKKIERFPTRSICQMDVKQTALNDWDCPQIIERVLHQFTPSIIYMQRRGNSIADDDCVAGIFCSKK